MKKETLFSIITSIIVFIILGAGYEYCVYLWSLQEQTPVIRVDIFIIYPIILLVSILVFFLLKKMNSIIKSIFILLGIIILAVAGAGMYKFNYLSGQPGYDVDGNKIAEIQEPQTENSHNTDEQKIIDETMKDIENLEKEMNNTENKDIISLEFNEKVGSDTALNDFLKKYVAENGDAEFEKDFSENEKTHFNIAKTDLNNDGVSEIFVKLEGSFWCGTGGCPVLLLQKTENSYKIVNDFAVVQGISVNEKEKTNGWKNLVFVAADGGSITKNEVVFQQHIGKYDYWKY